MTGHLRINPKFAGTQVHFLHSTPLSPLTVQIFTAHKDTAHNFHLMQNNRQNCTPKKSVFVIMTPQFPLLFARQKRTFIVRYFLVIQYHAVWKERTKIKSSLKMEAGSSYATMVPTTHATDHNMNPHGHENLEPHE